MVLLLLTFCLLLLPLWESVTVLCFVVRYLMSILVLQSSWWGRESWLFCLICLPGVSWWLSGSFSRCHGVVCGLWLWYFLIILTYYFRQFFPNKVLYMHRWCLHGPINSYHSFWWSNLILCLYNVDTLNICMKEFGSEKYNFWQNDSSENLDNFSLIRVCIFIDGAFMGRSTSTTDFDRSTSTKAFEKSIWYFAYTM